VERVKAGLRNARAKGKQLGRPKKILDTRRIAALRAKGVGWKRIAAELGGWSRNYLPRRPGGFQDSGNGFLNP
jgi:DNA invertase Pin-like site-specific DNA recombinase